MIIFDCPIFFRRYAGQADAAHMRDADTFLHLREYRNQLFLFQECLTMFYSHDALLCLRQRFSR